MLRGCAPGRATLDLEEIKRGLLVGDIAKFTRPERLEFIVELPMNAAGMIERRESHRMTAESGRQEPLRGCAQ